MQDHECRGNHERKQGNRGARAKWRWHRWWMQGYTDKRDKWQKKERSGETDSGERTSSLGLAQNWCNWLTPAPATRMGHVVKEIRPSFWPWMDFPWKSEVTKQIHFFNVVIVNGSCSMNPPQLAVVEANRRTEIVVGWVGNVLPIFAFAGWTIIVGLYCVPYDMSGGVTVTNWHPTGNSSRWRFFSINCLSCHKCRSICSWNRTSRHETYPHTFRWLQWGFSLPQVDPWWILIAFCRRGLRGCHGNPFRSLRSSPPPTCTIVRQFLSTT